MEQKFLYQRNPKPENSQFLTLEDLKRKVAKRKSIFFEENVLLLKSKTPQTEQKLSPTFNNIESTPKKTPRKFMALNSPQSANLKFGNIKTSFTENSPNSQEYVQRPNTERVNDISNQTTKPQIKNNQNFIWKKQHQQSLQLNASKKIQTVAHNFTSSFRVIFKELIHAYFLQIFLKKKIKHMTPQIWIYLLQNSGLQSMLNQEILKQRQIDSKKLLTSIHRLLGKEFNLRQVQNMLRIFFPQKNTILYEDFQNLLDFDNKLDFFNERSYENLYNSLSLRLLANEFYKTLIESADLYKKLRMICSANENELIKFVLEISSGPMIAIDKLSTFLDANDNQGSKRMKLTEAKVSIFIAKMLNKKNTKYEFIKWLKNDDQLLI